MIIKPDSFKNTYRNTKHRFPHRVTITLSDKLYRKIKKLAIEERRTIPQQICYLMEIGYDLIDQEIAGCTESAADNTIDEVEELTPAIGFRVESQVDDD